MMRFPGASISPGLSVLVTGTLSATSTQKRNRQAAWAFEAVDSCWYVQKIERKITRCQRLGKGIAAKIVALRYQLGVLRLLQGSQKEKKRTGGDPIAIFTYRHPRELSQTGRGVARRDVLKFKGEPGERGLKTQEQSSGVQGGNC